MRVRIRIKTSSRPQRSPSVESTSRKWFAMGTLATYAMAGSSVVLQAATPVPPAPAPSQQVNTVGKFAIPAGPLADVIPAFEKASGLKITIANEGIKGVTSPGVTGLLSPSQALEKMLDGTGVSARVSGLQVTLDLSHSGSSVDVVDRAPVSSPRYTEPLRNIPQTITIIPKEIISQQGATSLTDVLRNVPGLTITAGEGGVPGGDNLTLRGNSARNDIFVDGVRDLSPQSRDPFNLEQVEVSKGPTSTVSGRGSAGGTINLMSKGPSLGRIIGGSVALGNADTKRATIDLNAPLQRLGMGERTAFRLNGMVHDAGVAGRDVVNNGRWGLAPSLAFGLGTPTRVTLGYYKLRQDNITDYGIPWVPATNNALAAYRDQPAPVPRNTFYGFANRDREVLNQDTATVKFEHDFSDDLRIQSQLRYGRAGRNSVATPPRFAGNDSTAINREMRAWVATDKIWDNQTDLRATNVKTGSISHNLITGAAFTNENNLRRTRTAPNSPTTLLSPNPNDVYPGTFVEGLYPGNITGNTQAAWIFDTAKLGKHFEATGGVRFERFDVNGVSTTPAPVQQTVNWASLRGGLIYKPTDSGSIYASYGSSISPSLEGLSYNTSNTAIPPEKTYTVETGTKWEIFHNRLLLNGAIFQVKKDNARTPGLLPTDPPQVLAGRQVSQGLELSASGAITRSVRVLASYSLIDARIHSSNTPAEIGRFFQNTPRNSASIWTTYTAKRFTLGVGPRFMGRRFGNNINTRQVKAYNTIDAMVSYELNRNVGFRFNVSNLSDTFYFERLGGGHLIPGASRFALFTTNFRF